MPDLQECLPTMVTEKALDRLGVNDSELRQELLTILGNEVPAGFDAELQWVIRPPLTSAERGCCLTRRTVELLPQVDYFALLPLMEQVGNQMLASACGPKTRLLTVHFLDDLEIREPSVRLFITSIFAQLGYTYPLARLIPLIKETVRWDDVTTLCNQVLCPWLEADPSEVIELAEVLHAALAGRSRTSP